MFVLNGTVCNFQITYMKGGFQKVKLGRKSSAASTSKERPIVIEKQDRLQQLKAKIEKDRDVMRKTGKRFNKQGELITSQSNIQSREEKIQTISMTTPFFRRETKNVQSQIKEEGVKQQSKVMPATEKTSIKLTELIPSAAEKQLSMESSRVFDKEINQQKNRNQQIHKFLTSINLQQFAEGIINMGYDQLSVLVEIKSQELNFLMMRAAQQRRLTEALKQYRQKNGIQQQKNGPLIDKPAAFKAKVKMPEEKRQVQTASHAYRPKSAVTQASTIPTNNSSLFSNPAFFCSIGGNQWSMESLIRRACSTCYKVLPSSDLQQKNDCFYCKQCISIQQDLLGLTLSDSMVRDYS